MKKTFTRIFSLLLACILLFSSIPAASAYTVDEASLTSSEKGGNKTVFYVDANDKGTVKLKYTCSAGMFIKSGEKTGYKYGFFEVRVWGRNKTSENWTELTKYKVNIKNDFTGTVKMKGYTQYRVQVYAWKTTTIGKTLGGKYNWTGASWSVFCCPTITFVEHSGPIKRLTRI